MKALKKSELKNIDLLFYQPTSFFGVMIALFHVFTQEPIKFFLDLLKWDVRLPFCHVWGIISWQRFDALEWNRTWFRDDIGNAYVYRINNLTVEERRKARAYILSREGSYYDKRWVASYLIPTIQQSDFRDYCSELWSNWLCFAGIIEKTDKLSPYGFYKKLRDEGKIKFIWIVL